MKKVSVDLYIDDTRSVTTVTKLIAEKLEIEIGRYLESGVQTIDVGYIQSVKEPDDQ